MIGIPFALRPFVAISVLVGLPVFCSAAPAGETVLLSSRFANSSLSGWTVVDEGTINAPSMWRVENGELSQSSNIWGGSQGGGDWRHRGTYLRFDAGASWTDYRLSLVLRSDDDDALGAMFRVNGNDYYRFSWDASNGYRRLVKHVAGEFALLAEDRTAYRRGHDHLVEITASGPELRVSIDGEAVFNVWDDSVPAGSVALYTWSNRASYFDDVLVTSLATPAVASRGISPSQELLARWSAVGRDVASDSALDASWNVAPVRDFAPARPALVQRALGAQIESQGTRVARLGGGVFSVVSGDAPGRWNASERERSGGAVMLPLSRSPAWTLRAKASTWTLRAKRSRRANHLSLALRTQRTSAHR